MATYDWMMAGLWVDGKSTFIEEEVGPHAASFRLDLDCEDWTTVMHHHTDHRFPSDFGSWQFY